MRLVKAGLYLLLCATSIFASPPDEGPPDATEEDKTINHVSPVPTEPPIAVSETTISPLASSPRSSTTTEVSRVEEAPSERITSSLASSTAASSIPETITTSTSIEALTTTSSELLSPSSTTSSPPTVSPPSSDSSSPSPLHSIPPLPSVSIVTEVPLTSIPPVPEFLSFNEWREKFVVVPDPSLALARRAKKAAQRQRQDVVGSGSVGDKGATYDGDGADLGSLFSSGDESGGTGGGGEPSPRTATRRGQAVGSDSDRSKRKTKEDYVQRTEPLEGRRLATDALSPLQPLPNVGSGDDNDPLVALKDRSNYAAFECAAMVHRSSRKTKGASAILVEKKDRYMLTPCAADPKFVEVELCDEIQIDTIVLANFEFFSSMFKHFKASCSVNYPGNVDDWHDLGTFRARNVRGVQVFRPKLIPNFCRYIRINFLSHFGSEYYCPVSLLRVYGYTQLDAYRESERKARQLQEALAAAEEYVEDDPEELELQEEVEVVKPEEYLKREQVDSQGDIKVGGVSERANIFMTQEDLEDQKAAVGSTGGAAKGSDVFDSTSTITSPASSSTFAPTASESEASQSSTISPASSTATPTLEHDSSNTETGSSVSASSGAREVEAAETTNASSQSSPTVAIDSPVSSVTPSEVSTTVVPPTTSLPPEVAKSPNVSQPTVSASSASSRPANPSDLPIINPRSLIPRNDTPHVPPYVQPHRPPILSPPVQQPQPGESIYATIMKRLTSLEHNQTLSMHFIEAQSSMLREAFTRIERRLSEVEATRSRQEQGIRQALLELERERNELERERLGLSNQVGILAREMRFEKRLSAVQLVGTLLLILFVGFTRSIPTSPFLHLASSAQSQRRSSPKRSIDVGEPEEPSTEEKSSPDLPRKHLNRRSSGNGGTKPSAYAGHSKRLPSISKPGPRRHYGTGTSSSSRTPAFVKSPRAWTPPLRHSSAPPEDLPANEGKEPRRRHGSNRRPGSPFEFPRRSKLDTQLGLAIDSLPSQQTTSSPSTVTKPLPPFPTSDSRKRSFAHGVQPTTADEADIEPSDIGDSLNPSSNTIDDFDHYATTDEEDEPPIPPSTYLPHIRSPSSSGPDPSIQGPRPPKPTLPSRPSTSMGIRFPSRTSSASPSRSDLDFRRSPSRLNGRAPSPPSVVPSPPPEPILFDPNPPANIVK